MMRLVSILKILGALAAVALAGGCGDSYGGRCAVSGTIMFQGKPLDHGQITFVPTSPGLATQAGTDIRAGRYAIARAKGLVPGKYRVIISSGDGVTPADPSGGPPGPSGNFSSKERIPSAYNTGSRQEVEVTKQGPNQFDFTIP